MEFEAFVTSLALLSYSLFSYSKIFCSYYFFKKRGKRNTELV